MKSIRELSVFSDEEKKARWLRFAGWALAVFTAFTLIAIVSYFFTWKQDQSLLTDPAMMDSGHAVRNLAGKSGFLWANFLVAESFGLAALALVAFLAAASVRLIRPSTGLRIGRWCCLAVGGSFLWSWILSAFGSLSGLRGAFGSGPGGRSGDVAVQWADNLVGPLVVWIILLLLLAAWVLALVPDISARLKGSGHDASEQEESQDDSTAGRERAAGVLKKGAPVGIPDQPEDHTVIPQEPEPKLRKKPSPEPKEEPILDGKPEGGLEVVTDDTLTAEVKKELPRINNRDELPAFKFPPLTLLGDYLSGRNEVSHDELERNNNKIRATLANYKIAVNDVTAIVGPTVTLYKVYPAPGVKIAAIKSLQEDIAMSLNARGVRIVTLSDSVGIEVANDRPSIVPLKSLLNDPAFRESKAELPVAIGYTITQKVKVFDLADAPHLLVAGATKQGKSVGLNVIVSSLLYSKHPSELKFIFIDPKMVEFSAYGNLLNHYLAMLPSAASEQEEQDKAIVKNPKDAAAVLKSLCEEMDQRYALLNQAGVNNIKRYNDKFRDRHLLPTEGHRFLPYLVTIIDEYADLTMSTGAGPESKALARSITTSVIRLAQKGRAAGLHVILATQRPTVDVVTGLIKTNFPMRIAFRVTSRIDSMTILDNPGADKLIGKGDMLIYSGIEMERVQCGYVDGDEINSITGFIHEQQGYKKSYNTPYYLPEPQPEEGSAEGGGPVDMKNIDERFEEAARLIVSSQRGSTSDLQRRLGMGYAKAGRVMDQLQAAGIVGPQEGSKPREVLVKDFAELDELLSHFLGK